MPRPVFVPIETVEWLLGDIYTDSGAIVRIVRGPNYVAAVAEIEARGDVVTASRLVLRDATNQRFHYHRTGVVTEVPTENID